ncbi:uncharacterized protein B0I36DRAFT_376998 [Microdochium trichocladiopsis]|uniref:Uncharacterized protein n=1 Tax=Microdochium trichocladiopsis TaxID=1682393 RepID=A0A9P8XWX0_9PEZI|nr:uncharacterized protein B0I36DRAFT_376998 [Microdochium trichocladiopsis]KAH7020867.1 hypothetical protein B0I36DRAFT_376998 [Microdochium trichocladiopsis]
MASTAPSVNPLSAANLFNVNGMVAVVTGGGSGIGLMITRALAANGAAKIFILGRRLHVLEETAASVQPAGTVIPVQCDVTQPASLAAAAAQVAQVSPHIDLLVCNSGIIGPYGIRPDANTTLDDFVAANLAVPAAEFTETFNVNASSAWYTTMSFLKLLDAGNKARPWSQVIVVASIAAFNKQNSGGYAYGQSKAAAVHLVKQLSIALPRWDVRVNAICPGLYPSQMSAPIIAKGGIGRDMIPLMRPGDEQDMAGTILYLASRAGAYCNGTVILSDGGRLGTFPSTF